MPARPPAFDRLDKKPLGFTDLKAWLRHRHPMILLDRILDHEPGQFVTAIALVSGALDSVAGHFPERAIYPGSNLIQAFSQGGIILFQMSTRKLQDDELTLVGSVEARFFKLIVPGDVVTIHVKAERIIRNMFQFTGTATVELTRVAAMRATLIRVHEKELGPPLW
jgi:3-hydroxyacyl-[acyl-carrier-protein] dehydratase